MQLNKVLEGYWLVKSQEFSEATVVTYELVFRRLQEFLGAEIEFDQISAIDIRKFLKHLRETYTLADRTVHDYWIPLSSLWTWAKDELGTEHIIRDKVKRPSYNKTPIEPFTFDEVKALVQAAEYTSAWLTNNGKRVRSKRPTAARDKAVVLILLDCGLRASELCDLTIGNYDSERGKIFIRKGKGNKKRILFLGTGARRAIWRYLAERPNAEVVCQIVCKS